MDKLQMVHEYAKVILERVDLPKYDFIKDEADYIATVANSVADSVIAQYEKKNPVVEVQGEWQPDWSIAPQECRYWAMDGDGSCNWYASKPQISGCVWDFGNVMFSAYDFDYQGNWRLSLRKRPK